MSPYYISCYVLRRSSPWKRDTMGKAIQTTVLQCSQLEMTPAKMPSLMKLFPQKPTREIELHHRRTHSMVPRSPGNLFCFFSSNNALVHSSCHKKAVKHCFTWALGLENHPQNGGDVHTCITNTHQLHLVAVLDIRPVMCGYTKHDLQFRYLRKKIVFWQTWG